MIQVDQYFFNWVGSTTNQVLRIGKFDVLMQLDFFLGEEVGYDLFDECMFFPDMVEPTTCFFVNAVWIRFDGSFMCGQYEVVCCIEA